MLHHQEKETVDFAFIDMKKLAAIAAAESAELKHLQKQRTKANKDRKIYWQKRIDVHFGM
jgi:hypothetical protein